MLPPPQSYSHIFKVERCIQMQWREQRLPLLKHVKEKIASP